MNISRRDYLRLSTCGAVGLSLSQWFPQFARAATADPKRKRACILLWMSGGPSQLDTFDPKPDHENGGEFKPIETAVPGIQICEHLPGVAKAMKDLAIVRSMRTKEGDHARATYKMRTGYLPQGPVSYPAMGSFLSKELGESDAELPNYVSIAPYRFLSPGAFGPGFLGPRHTPLVVGGMNSFVRQTEDDYEQSLEVRNLSLPEGVTRKQADARLGLLESLERDFMKSRPGVPVGSHRASYLQAVRMMRSDAVKAFQLDEEKAAIRDAYGRNQFGQGCLLARRLVERGVPFVEVSLSGVQGGALGWDTHGNNFETVKGLCGVLDPAWSTLMKDLKDRGLLETTMVVWMGEFGRTPVINQGGGRDHWPGSWTTVLGGGGIKGGQVHGATAADGVQIKKDPVNVPNFLATICKGLGVDHTTTNISNVGRPIPLADHESEPIEALLS